MSQNIKNEISLSDIKEFLVDSWVIILISALLGLIVSLIYLMVTPNQYQAIAHIQMAQYNPSKNDNLLGVNIEDPNLLIARFKIPSNYTTEQIKSCGMDDLPDAAQNLASSVQFSIVKGVGSVVELRISRMSKEQAFECAKGIFESIGASQDEIVMPYVEAAKALLIKYQEKLSAVQGIVARADKSGVALSAAYLASRDEVKFLTEEISRLNTFIATGHAKKTKLISPIYVSDKPIYPKKRISLIIGLVLGFIAGLIFSAYKKCF